MVRGRWKSLLIAGLVAGTLAAAATTASAVSRPASSSQATKSAVNVGVVYSRTGLLSAYGAEFIEGLRLGLNYVTGGTGVVAGHKINFTIEDDKTDPATAVSDVKDLIGKGIKIITGTVSSGVALQVGPLAAQNNILYISGPAASDAITGLNKNTFRAGRQTTQDVLAAGSFLKGAGKNVVVFAQDSAFGQGNFAAVNAFLGAKGHHISKVLVPLSATDFTPFAQQAKQANPDLLFVAWAGTTAGAMWRALDQQGVLSSTTVTTGLAERATYPSYGDPSTASKIKFLSHYVYTAPHNKVNDWLVKTLKKRNQVPDLFTPDGFVAAQMIAHAVQKADGDDVGKMISALEGWQFLAPKGIQRIRPQDHAMLQPMFQVQLTFPKGKAVPKVLATISPGNVQPPVHPFP